MFSQRVIQRSLITAFVLSFAGVAFARQPPVLTNAQRAAERALVCEGAQAKPGAGYRAAFVRGSQVQASPMTVDRTASGYRDAIRRFGVGPSASEVACGPSEGPRFSAGR
jgi:hypothetical protein